MKKVFKYLTSAAFVLFALCGCQSKEDKANKLIDAYMFKHLHDYKSYEVVETKVDTLYNTPLFDSECIESAILMGEHDKRAAEFEKAAARNKSSMNIWKGGWSAMAREEYNDAYEEYCDNMRSQITETQASLKLWKKILERCKELDGKEMIGWLIEHTYRCNNRGGNTMLSSTVFLVDKDFKTISSSFDSDDEEYEAAMKSIGSIMRDTTATPEQFDSLIVQYDEIIKRLNKNK